MKRITKLTYLSLAASLFTALGFYLSIIDKVGNSIGSFVVAAILLVTAMFCLLSSGIFPTSDDKER